MYYYDDDFFMMIFWIVAALFILGLFRRIMTSKNTSTSSAPTAAAKPVPKNQMAEDIRATKTSQVKDAVSILDDLGSTSSNYRHYCELVGTSMASSGVTAPYSRRQVAYYDIKCYRLDATYGGSQTETLVAHERSFDPFFFTDGSCDTPIYVDIESFGNNVILVNSTNHIEGPNSDFAQTFKKNATTATSGTSGAYAMVAHRASRGASALLGAVDALKRALTPRLELQPAFALAGGSLSGQTIDPDVRGSNVMFASPAGMPGKQGKPPAQSGSSKGQPQISIHVGYGPTRPPQHLGDFMGGYGGGPWVMGGGPGYGHHRPHSTDASDVLLGMSLGALLNSMTAAQQQAAQGYTTPQDTFRGYRLVENVVPLGSPIYCIGEIYRNGTQVYMGRSLAKDYPTSYFATKPESEVLSVIESR